MAEHDVLVRAAVDPGATGVDREAPAEVARVLLADDHDFVRTSLHALLDQHPHLEVVAECSDGDEVLVAARAGRPHVAVLDVMMARRGGLDAARELRAELPAVAVVLLTGRLDACSVREARTLGVRGYLLKGEHPEQLPDHVLQVARGGSAWSSAAVRLL